MDTAKALEKLEKANEKLKRSRSARNAQRQILIDSILLLARIMIESNMRKAVP